MEIIKKKMKDYGQVNMKTGKIYINPSKNRNGVEHINTIAHEQTHFFNPKMSEKNVEKRSDKLTKSILGAI